MKRIIYPFVAIVGQEDMKLALILNVINPDIGGVLIRGEKGTAKSTAVRALAEVLPEIKVVKDCPFQLLPYESPETCNMCPRKECAQKILTGEKEVEIIERKIDVVELPLGATEDRVVGTLDLEAALTHGRKEIEPGILAQAHRGILYVDEVNLLEDHLVDVLLDSAAMGINTVEREGISFSHPSRFVLIGTMNPEEGELRPQLLDRFGLCVTIEGIKEISSRVEILKRKDEFENNPEEFFLKWKDKSKQLQKKIIEAKKNYKNIETGEETFREIVDFTLQIGVDGHRADIVILKTAKALAAYEGETKVLPHHIEKAAHLAMPHRMRRRPFEEVGNHKTLFE